MSEIRDVFEMTPMQASMLFQSLYAPGEAAYFQQYWGRLDGELDAAAFRAAWDAVIARHDILRAQAHWEDLERPALAILDAARPDWTQEDWSELDPEAQRGRLDDWLAADRARGFDLAAAPLLRFALIRLGPDAHVFVWSFHHLLLDGWCGALLVREMLAIYGGATPEAPPPPFRAYVDWRAAQDASAAQAYWTAALAGMEAPTPLGFERTRTGATGQHERRFRLDAALTRALEATARRERLTLGALMQGAWALVLSRHAGQENVVFGLVQAGRPADLPGAEAMICLLLETVPVRAVAAPDRKVGDWLREIQAEGRARAAHGHAALQDIQAWSGQGGATRLFDSLLIVETYPESIETAVRREGAELRLSQTGVHERTNFPLTIKVLPGAEIEIILAADGGRIPADALPRLAGHLTRTLEAFAAGMEGALSAIDILTAEDHAAAAALGQGPARPAGPTALARFLAMAEVRPEAIAVETTEGERLSYAALAERARAIAAGLAARGVRRGDVVAICQDRACDLLASLIAVWRCGAAYLPLDPGYPSERIRYVLADAGAALALADAAGRAALGDAPGLPVAAVEACAGDGLPADPAAGEDIAYVLYTSGSTGRPKGVPIRHDALANFLDAMLEAPGVAPGTRMLALTTVAFDIAALELFGPLAAGGTVVLAPAGAGMDGRGLARMIATRQVDMMQATPAGWRVLRDAGWTGRPGLRMLSGGEALDSALARDLMRLGGALWNLYGPTETTIWSAALEVRPDHLDGPKVPIGGPIANTTLSVRGPRGEIAPLGAPGELWIGGDGLSPGYLGRPELTAERFVTFGGARFYRTGDRARMNPDGAIDFLGRLDDQVKLRGHRIELGEIEARLEAHPGVVQAVAAVRGEGAAARLVAYLRCEGPAPDRAALRAHLAAALPAYMIPSAFVALDRMPLTPNGKIDRKALPAPEAPAAAAPAASSPRDEIVAGIWAGVLGVGAVGPADDFFALGGHSLLATRAIGEIRRRLGVEPALRDLFEAPVLAAFCARLDALRPAPVLPPLERAAGRPMLSAAQRRQWLLARLDPGSSAYHLPLAVALDGPLDPEALARALTALTARHDVLRCHFPVERGVATVAILPGFVPVLHRDDLGALSEAERTEALSRLRRAEARASFDLGAAPPWRARLVRLGEGRHVLLLTLHHILADEWSFGMMLDDLAAAYAGRELQPLPAQYPDFAAWQERLDLAAQRAFWRRALAGAPAWAALPADRPRPDRRSGEAGRTALAVSPETARRLEALARAQGATPFLVLLAAWAALIGRHAGETDLIIAAPVSNRRLPELHGLVGLFVNTLALRCDLGGDPDFATLIARLRETTLAAHAHQDLPFEQVIDALAPPRREGTSPLAQVFFALAEAPRTGALGPDLAWRALPGEATAARFDLSLELWRDAGGLAGRIDFARDMFDQDTAERLARRFERLLEGLGRAADLPVSTLPLLDEADLRIALPPLQPGESDPAAWLERRATIRPDAPAVRRAGRTISHADLRALLRDGAPDPLSRALAAPMLVGEDGGGDCLRYRDFQPSCRPFRRPRSGRSGDLRRRPVEPCGSGCARRRAAGGGLLGPRRAG